jgi:hypothetical protein
MNLTGKYIVLKGSLGTSPSRSLSSEGDSLFTDRVVKCVNHENGMITFRRLDRSNSEIIFISEIEGYLIFNEISDLMIGDYVSYVNNYYMNEFADHIPITKSGIIIAIEYSFNYIMYSIKTEDNNVITKSQNDLIYEQKPSFRINCYASIFDEVSKRCIDGEIIDIDFVKKIYKIKFLDGTIKNIELNKINKPTGYNFIKI